MAKIDNRLFTVAGTTSEPGGDTKVRFGNDLAARVKIFNAAGHVNITLQELPRAMTKLEALEYLHSLNLEGDAGFAVASKLAEKNKQAKAAAKKATLTVARSDLQATTEVEAEAV